MRKVNDARFRNGINSKSSIKLGCCRKFLIECKVGQQCEQWRMYAGPLSTTMTPSNWHTYSHLCVRQCLFVNRCPEQAARIFIQFLSSNFLNSIKFCTLTLPKIAMEINKSKPFALSHTFWFQGLVVDNRSSNSKHRVTNLWQLNVKPALCCVALSFVYRFRPEMFLYNKRRCFLYCQLYVQQIILHTKNKRLFSHMYWLLKRTKKFITVHSQRCFCITNYMFSRLFYTQKIKGYFLICIDYWNAPKMSLMSTHKDAFVLPTICSADYFTHEK